MNCKIVTLACASISMVMSSFASAAAITSGNLVLMRAGGTALNGPGAAALTTGGTAVFLDEYTTTGTYVQTLPVSSSGADALVVTGSSGSEGLLTPSQDGTQLVFAGYRSTVGATTNALSGTAIARVAGTVNLAGTVDTTFSTSGVGSGAARSATTANGSSFYYGTGVGVYYGATSGGAGTLIEARNSRQVFLANGNLFATNGSTGTAAKVQHYGQTPTAARPATPIVTLATSDVTQGLYMLDLSASVAGVDTLYFVNQATNLIAKYTYNGTSWSSNGTIAAVGTSAADILAVVNGSNVDLYMTNGAALYKTTDTSGYGGAISGTFASLISAPTNTAFRGLGSLPSPANTTLVALPEPTSLFALGAMATLAIRRRGR